jgi:hypothetical protein
MGDEGLGANICPAQGQAARAADRVLVASRTGPGCLVVWSPQHFRLYTRRVDEWVSRVRRSTKTWGPDNLALEKDWVQDPETLSLLSEQYSTILSKSWVLRYSRIEFRNHPSDVESG